MTLPVVRMSSGLVMCTPQLCSLQEAQSNGDLAPDKACHPAPAHDARSATPPSPSKHTQRAVEGVEDDLNSLNPHTESSSTPSTSPTLHTEWSLVTGTPHAQMSWVRAWDSSMVVDPLLNCRGAEP